MENVFGTRKMIRHDFKIDKHTGTNEFRKLVDIK